MENVADRSLSVLLVEDNATDAFLIEEILERSLAPEFCVTRASRLDLALKHLAEHIFDVVLLDLGLPDSEGLATLSAVREGYAKIPIVIYSGIADEQIALKAVREGADDYLVKGVIAQRNVPKTIQYAIERRRADDRLSASEEGNQKLLESMTEAFISVDTEWRCTYFNAQATRMLERETKSLIGVKFWEAFPAVVDTIFFSEYQRAMRDQVVVSFDAYYAPLNKWREVHAHPTPTGLSIFLSRHHG